MDVDHLDTGTHATQLYPRETHLKTCWCELFLIQNDCFYCCSSVSTEQYYCDQWVSSDSERTQSKGCLRFPITSTPDTSVIIFLSSTVSSWTSSWTVLEFSVRFYKAKCHKNSTGRNVPHVSFVTPKDASQGMCTSEWLPERHRSEVHVICQRFTINHH